ncbi:MAG: hypothetical protein AAF221_02730 [Pseudomonadota bacterium]
MRALLSWFLLSITAALTGAQIMVALEAQFLPLLTLGQSAALAWLPDPATAAAAVNAVTEASGFAARTLSLPALPIFAGFWALSLMSRVSK